MPAFGETASRASVGDGGGTRPTKRSIKRPSGVVLSLSGERGSGDRISTERTSPKGTSPKRASLARASANRAEPLARRLAMIAPLDQAPDLHPHQASALMRLY